MWAFVRKLISPSFPPRPRNDNHQPIRVANADCAKTLFSRCGSGDINNILRQFDATGAVQLMRVARIQKMSAARGCWSLVEYPKRREIAEHKLCVQARLHQRLTEKNCMPSPNGLRLPTM